MDLNDFKLVTISNFYACAREAEAYRYFSDALFLRVNGFGPEYDRLFLPFDTADFICTHHLIYFRDKAKWKPVAGFRNMTLRDCESYNLSFPFVKVLEESRSKDHERALQDLMAKYKAQNRDLLYYSAMTIHQEYRGIKWISDIFKEMVCAIYYENLKLYPNSASVCAAVLRFKIDSFFSKMGYKPVSIDNKILSSTINPFAKNEPILYLTLDEAPNDFVSFCRKKHDRLIAERQVLVAPVEVNKAV